MSPTRPTLVGINCDGPVVVRELGQGHNGIVWTVQPKDFSAVVDMINSHGGPDRWRITPVR